MKPKNFERAVTRAFQPREWMFTHISGPFPQSIATWIGFQIEALHRVQVIRSNRKGWSIEFTVGMETFDTKRAGTLKDAIDDMPACLDRLKDAVMGSLR